VSHLVLFAARNAEIEARLALLKRAEIDPIALDLDSAALANAFTLSSHYDDTRNILLVDMGATSTKIVLLEGGRMKKTRSLRTGCTVLDPGRMIAEPAAEAVLATGGANGRGRAIDTALELRFQELESAVRDLHPGRGGLFSPGAEGDLDLGAQASRRDAPIAILSDEDYALVEDADLEAGSGVATEGFSWSRRAEADALEAPRAETSRAESAEAEADALEAALHAESNSGAEESGAGASADESSDYRTYLERVGVEIQRTLATTQLDAPIQLICLTGGMSRRDEARRYFQETFDIETVRLDFAEALATDLDPGQLDLVATEGAVAVGLAAKGLGKDLVGLDFRKGPYRYEHRLERIRVPLLVCGILCFFVFLQTAFWSFHRCRYLREHAVAYEENASRIYETFFGKPPAKGRNPVDSAREQKKRWEAGGLSNVGRFLPYVDVVRDVSKAMASTGLFFRLSSINYKFGLTRTVKTQGSTKKEEWKSAGDSQIVLETDDSNGHLKIENAFDRSPRSQFFDAETTSSPQTKGDYKVTVKLKVSQKVLSAPETSGGPAPTEPTAETTEPAAPTEPEPAAPAEAETTETTETNLQN
jgi:hypothetical protein